VRTVKEGQTSNEPVRPTDDGAERDSHYAKPEIDPLEELRCVVDAESDQLHDASLAHRARAAAIDARRNAILSSHGVALACKDRVSPAKEIYGDGRSHGRHQLGRKSGMTTRAVISIRGRSPGSQSV